MDAMSPYGLPAEDGAVRRARLWLSRRSVYAPPRTANKFFTPCVASLAPRSGALFSAQPDLGSGVTAFDCRCVVSGLV
jgi:hypothetical protein